MPNEESNSSLLLLQLLPYSVYLAVLLRGRIASICVRQVDPRAFAQKSSCNRARAHVGGQDGSGGDHDRMLGLSQSATSQDIKNAFRQRARQCHPDVNKGVGAVDQFKGIRLAYEVLSDETKRREYDERLRGRAKKRRKPRGRSQRGPSYAHYSRVAYHRPEWTVSASAQGRDGRSASAGSTVDDRGAQREHDDASRQASSGNGGLQVLDYGSCMARLRGSNGFDTTCCGNGFQQPACSWTQSGFWSGISNWWGEGPDCGSVCLVGNHGFREASWCRRCHFSIGTLAGGKYDAGDAFTTGCGFSYGIQVY